MFVLYYYINKKELSFLISLTHVIVEKILFYGHIFEVEIWMNLHDIKSPKSENQILSVFSVCMCACYHHNSEINYSSNIKFGILHFYHLQMLLETFYKDWTKTLCTGAHK